MFWDNRPIKEVLVRFARISLAGDGSEPKFHLFVDDKQLIDRHGTDNTYFLFQVNDFIKNLEKAGYQVLKTLE